MRKCILLFAICLFFSGVSSGQEKLTLEQSIDIALKSNQSIQIVKKKIDEAKSGLIISRAGFLPSLSLSGSMIRLEETPTISIGGQNIAVGGEYTYNFQLVMRQPVYTWGKISNYYKISRYNLKSVETEYSRQCSLIKFEVTKSFYTILFLEKMRGLLQESYKQLQRHLDTTKERYENGLAPKLDLLRAEVQLANYEPQLTEIENNLSLANKAFNILLGTKQETEIFLQGEFKFEDYTITEEEAIKTALSQRQEIISLGEREKIGRSNLSLAKAGNKPNFSLLYNYPWQKPYRWQDVWGGDWTVGLYLDFPFFSGFSNYGKIEQAKAQYEQIEIESGLLKENIILEVRRVLLSLKKEKENIYSQEQNIKHAEEALKIAEERYKNGLLTNLEFLDTQLAFTQAKTNYWQSLSNYMIAQAELKKVVGE